MLKFFVEFLGTFVFLSVILLKGKAIPIGIALAAVIFMGGDVSGGNFNPAVSFSMLMSDKLNVMNFVGYVAVQLLAAACAVYFVKSSHSLVGAEA